MTRATDTTAIFRFLQILRDCGKLSRDGLMQESGLNSDLTQNVLRNLRKRKFVLSLNDIPVEYRVTEEGLGHLKKVERLVWMRAEAKRKAKIPKPKKSEKAKQVKVKAQLTVVPKIDVVSIAIRTVPNSVFSLGNY